MIDNVTIVICIFVIIFIIGIIHSIINSIKDYKKYQIENNYCHPDECPILTKVIHCCDDISNFKKYNIGDIVEEFNEGYPKYYICTKKKELKRLHINLVMRLEDKYNIKIISKY